MIKPLTYILVLLSFKFSSGQVDTTTCKLTHDKVAKRDYYLFTETVPKYPDGNELMMAFIKNNLNLPSHCYEINETAYLSFVVESNGKLTFLKELRHFNHPDITKEVIRVISKMPKWTPATCKGKPVDALINIPIKFSLK